MTVFCWVLPLVLLGSQDQPESIASEYAKRVPKASPVRVAGNELWKLRPAPVRYGRVGSEPVVCVVGGRRVTIRPTKDFPLFDDPVVGSDGSIYIHRILIGEGAGDSRETIWYRGREQPVPGWGVEIYRGRLNYLGCTFETSAHGMPQSAPSAYWMKGGVVRQLGWGRPVYWGKDGAMALVTPIDDHGVPSGTEMTTGSATRLLWKGHVQTVPGYSYLGADRTGTVYLVSGPGPASVGNGYMSLSLNPALDNRCLCWRHGRFLAHWEMPAGWRIVDVANDGRLFLRRSPASATPPDLSKFGAASNRAMMEAMNRMEEASIAHEKNWDSALVKSGKMTVIRFVKPTDAAELLWRERPTAYGGRAFRFQVFYGNRNVGYRASAE